MTQAEQIKEQARKNGKATTAASPLQREAKIPKEVAALLLAMGVPLPPNVKEIETEVEFSEDTQKIIVPKGMDKLQASKELENQWHNEEQLIDFTTDFKGWDWQDVLVAVKRVTEREFGWMNAHATWFEGNPTEIDVIVDIVKGKTVSEKAFYGSYKITAWEKASCSVNVSKFGVASIAITAKRKHSEVITKYLNLIRQQLETASIYRGKSIVVTQNEGKCNFSILENKGSDAIILNRKEDMVINTFVINSLGEPGKRCYLFTGGYGTGKTETAMKIGRIASSQHGMSFFYLKDAKAFDILLNQCKQYQPCIIFLEDLDEIGSGEQRDAQMNKILNTLDGVQTKGNDLTVIFTTNNPQKINSGLRRPGRIDLMVKFDNPDNETKAKIYKLYFDNQSGIDYDYLAHTTGDVQGAVVAEIAQRAIKLQKHTGVLNTESVESCIHSMKFQIELMNEEPNAVNKYEVFCKQLGNVIFESEKGKSLLEQHGIQ